MIPPVGRFGRYGRLGRMAVALASLWLAGSALPAAAGTRYYVPNEYIITVKSGTTASVVQQVVAKMGGSVVSSLSLPNTYLIRMGTPTVGKSPVVRSKSTAAARAVVIEKIQPNILYHPCAVPNDPGWANQWDMLLINCPRAWDIEKGDETVRVAVVDTGVGYNHPDLAGRCINGYDSVDRDYDPMDPQGHGTHVAGTIAAQGNNGIGVCGVCWDGVKIMPIRALASEGGSTAMIDEGLDYALTHGAHVVNMSLGGPPDLTDPVFRTKCAQLANLGVIIVAAAGNDSANVGVPGMFPEVICVGATGPDDGIAPYSSFGPGREVDIAAPGGNSRLNTPGTADAMIYGTHITWITIDNVPVGIYDYASFEGTSMACPHVAGAAALLLSQGIPAWDVRNRLLSTARSPGVGPFDARKYGAGILDVAAALATASVKIVQPAKGANTSTDPQFKITLRGIEPNTVRVLFDYADAGGDGMPDNPAEAPIISSGNLSLYANTARTEINFTWSQLTAGGQLAPGRHYIYVQADPVTGGDPVYDWTTFTVSSLSTPAGLYLASFPYVLDTTAVAPSDILTSADFSTFNPARSILKRYLTILGGYASYYPGNPADLCWVNPMVGGAPMGGAYLDLVRIDEATGTILDRRANQFVYPAGAGFWLILSGATPVSDAYKPLDTYVDPLGYVMDVSQGCRIPLYRGWNMIGNPYAHAIPLGGALVEYQGDTRTLFDAAAGWITTHVFGYSTQGMTGYRSIGPGDLLLPYQGYWVRALVGTTTPGQSLYLRLLP